MWRRRFTSSTFPTPKATKNKKWDAVVVGGGHNGLTAAAYLARAGLAVLVLERRHLAGGAAVTEELVPGFRFSRCSYLQSLLRPAVIRDLDLRRHGLHLLKRDPSSFTPTLDGRYLLLGPSPDLNRSEISKFSPKDAAFYPTYEQKLEKFGDLMDSLLDSPTPESRQGSPVSFSDRLKKFRFWAGLGRRLMGLGQSDAVDLVDLLVSPASKVLDRWFESDVLKATLATDAVIGSMASVHTPGSGYVLLHHVMGQTEGHRGIWSYVQGGMGSVSAALSSAAVEAGAEVVTGAEVAHIMVDEASRTAKGVILADGSEVASSIVLANTTPHLTFTKLVPASVLPDDFLSAVKSSDYSSGTTKINIAVDRLPQFKCIGAERLEPGPEHMGTIHIGAETMEEIDLACKDALNGYPSQKPLIEMTIPSSLDKTISPPGKHVVNLFVQYTPYKLAKGSWGDAAVRESFAQRCFSLIDEHAPGFSSSVIEYDMLAPPDLEREFGLTGGNIFHGAMSLDSMFLFRPVKGWSDYRTPLRGLYLCGSGAHPGGGVMGAPGRNAAHVVLQDWKKSA